MDNKMNLYENIFVTVIMSTRNTAEEYLEQSVESILHQTHKNFEFIITVDGSTNNDYEILKAYYEKDQRIKIIVNETNKGLAYSLNRMIDLSSGKYIFRMDSDDISYPNRIETMIKFLETNPQIDICGSQVNYLYDNNKTKRRRSFLPCKDKEIKYFFALSNSLAHPTVVLRKSSITSHKLKYSTEDRSEDYSLWVNSAIQGLCFANYNSPLLQYRIHSNQTVVKNKDELNECTLRIKRRYYNHLGFRIDESEIIILNSLFHDISKYNKNEINRIGRLLLELSDCFEGKKDARKFYANVIFRRVLANRSHLKKRVLIQKDFPLFDDFNIFEKLVLFFIRHGIVL